MTHSQKDDLAQAMKEVLASIKRGRCQGCLEPMPFPISKYCYLCDPCNGKPLGGNYGPYKDDTSPAWDNAVRALEECA